MAIQVDNAKMQENLKIADTLKVREVNRDIA